MSKACSHHGSPRALSCTLSHRCPVSPLAVTPVAFCRANVSLPVVGPPAVCGSCDLPLYDATLPTSQNIVAAEHGFRPPAWLRVTYYVYVDREGRASVGAL